MQPLPRLILILFSCLWLLPLSGPAWPQEKKPDSANLLQEADNLYRNHRYAEALDRYERYLAASPPAPQGQHAWLRTAQLYGIKGNWQEARSRYEKLLAVKTDSGIALQARYGVGQAQYKLGNFQEAERILENLSASNLPGELRFQTNALLTELSLQAGNVTQAFGRLLLVAKDLSFGEEEWFGDLKTRVLNRASPLDLEKLADLYRDTPFTPEILLQLVKVEVQAGRPEKGAAWATTLQQRFPDTPQAAKAKRLVPAGAKPSSPGATLGCLIPLSGENADVGRLLKHGVELAASQTGVAIIMKDCGNDEARTRAALEELAANPQVLALLGFFPSATADAAADTAQRLEIPLLALTQKKDVTLARSFVFRDFLTQRLMLQALVNYTANTLGWQRYAVLYPNSKYGHTLSRQFSEEVTRQAARLAGQASYTEGGRDLAQAVQTLTQINVGAEGAPSLDAVFIPDEAEVVAAVAREMGAASLGRVRLLGSNLLNNPRSLEFGELLEGVLFPDGFLAADSDPVVKAFVADFRQRFGQPPNYLAAQGYSSMRLLAHTLKEFTGLSRLEFASRLSHQTQPPGFSLFRGFNHEREAELTARIITIRNRTFEVEK